MTVNGNAYAWLNFDDLINQITLLTRREQGNNDEESRVNGDDDERQSGGGVVNRDDESAPIRIHQLDNQIQIKETKSGRVVLTYQLEGFPVPGEAPILLGTTSVMYHGEELPVLLYLLPGPTLATIRDEWSGREKLPSKQ